MSTHRIEVYPETCDVSTNQIGLRSWIAAGTYGGKRFTRKAETEGRALKSWKDFAEWLYRSG